MAYTRRINVRGIILNDGKLFAQTIKGSEQDHWCTPGGGLDDGESLTDGLHREMIEETGVAPEIGKLLFVQQFHDGKKEQIEFFFAILNARDYINIDLHSTSHGDIEIERCGFINPRTNNILPAMLQTIDLQSYLDEDKPVPIHIEL